VENELWLFSVVFKFLFDMFNVLKVMSNQCSCVNFKPMNQTKLITSYVSPYIYKIKFDSWARKLSEQLSKIGLGYIWQDLRVNTGSGICKKIKTDSMIWNSRIYLQTLK
jgi:hypothetical protein